MWRLREKWWNYTTLLHEQRINGISDIILNSNWIRINYHLYIIQEFVENSSKALEALKKRQEFADAKKVKHNQIEPQPNPGMPQQPNPGLPQVE